LAGRDVVGTGLGRLAGAATAWTSVLGDDKALAAFGYSGALELELLPAAPAGDVGGFIRRDLAVSLK